MYKLLSWVVRFCDHTKGGVEVGKSRRAKTGLRPIDVAVVVGMSGGGGGMGQMSGGEVGACVRGKWTRIGRAGVSRLVNAVWEVGVRLGAGHGPIERAVHPYVSSAQHRSHPSKPCAQL